MLRFSKDVTRSYMSFREEPPVEAVTGLGSWRSSPGGTNHSGPSWRSEVWKRARKQRSIPRLLVERGGRWDASALADRGPGSRAGLRQLGSRVSDCTGMSDE